ncbi:MAG: hypothetical protein V4736_12740 [Bdellovibrionota bacterium]
MDVFTSAPLGNLNFNDEVQRSSGFQQDNNRSYNQPHSLETLIAQNDDLMMRLKISLRRLATLENETRETSEENLKLKSALSQSQDQLYIIKEKEESLRLFEKDRYLAQSLEREVNVLRLQIQRYQKYQEKVKTQIKPYVQELKNFSTRMEEEKNAMEKDLNQKRSLTEDLKLQLRELIKNSQYEMEEQTKKSEAMVKYFEAEIERRETTIGDQRDQLNEVQTKVQMLAKIKQSRDILENHLIELEKSKEEIQNAYQKEVTELRAESQFLNRENSRMLIELGDLKTQFTFATREKSAVELKNRELTTQIDSLRAMWTDQQNEIEKLRKSQEALERLNLELSQKLANQPR